MPKRIAWLSSVLPASVTGLEEGTARSIEVVEAPPAWMCLECRGGEAALRKTEVPDNREGAGDG
ncbi:MAG: hypothetical protein JRM82_01565 [Nitrososphaerota archaeon]|nr:hypothetical protein [Nitrososphaerota archaeon]